LESISLLLFLCFLFVYFMLVFPLPVTIEGECWNNREIEDPSSAQDGASLEQEALHGARRERDKLFMVRDWLFTDKLQPHTSHIITALTTD
jgi:hypothetical protein